MTTDLTQTPTPSLGRQISKVLINVLITVTLVYILITAVSMVGSGFKWASDGGEAVKDLLVTAENPLSV